ncbi:MAG: PilZ domain-containing protein [Candidatus Aminicenantales bacterium]
MIKQPLAEDVDVLGAKDQGFTFPLPTLVEGLNARGKEFTEETVLSYISHQGSSFLLKNPVNIDMRLKLIVDLPEKLSEEKTLKLVIKGKVSQVEACREKVAGQRVTIRFDSKYIIRPDAS